MQSGGNRTAACLRPLCFISRHRAVLLAALLFAVIFVAVYVIMPQRPYATLNLPETTHVLRFSPDGGMLLTVADRPLSGWGWIVKGPIRVRDVRTGVERMALAPDRTYDPAPQKTHTPRGKARFLNPHLPSSLNTSLPTSPSATRLLSSTRATGATSSRLVKT